MTQADRDRLVTLRKAKKKLITMAGRAAIRRQAESGGMMLHSQPGLRSSRQVKRRPAQGNSPDDRKNYPGFESSQENLRRSTHPSTPKPELEPAGGAHTRRAEGPLCVFKAWRNLSVRCGPKQNQTLGRDRAASRRSAPDPGKKNASGGPRSCHRPR